ncbi:glutathione S-transferase N-terminal domain-containing protein [Algiphilus sp. W345]|uniref:Glutathione S-transferase N-terminal domain-containing protein n=1 Tax=Banduia mediterranea TaxID=3075609 RepID=A0ABU2WEA7_9GAMM|nr:glutathione S-transferase N-terminal domain-containing protein [Algiphilus sp. W345]MDT0496203.1 glutathione S-transferase N-terminal domain-containing protein [Algiphilus sp. W345]
MLKNSINVLSSLTASLAEAGRGVRIGATGPRPAELLVLYDRENCPYCRRVRQTLTELDLDVFIKPFPQGAERFRTELLKLGGRLQVPFLVDPNTGSALYESEDIVAYLHQHYGGAVASTRRFFDRAGSFGASLIRLRHGSRRRAAANAPPEPLELYSFETSPFARIVRERLCELEIPYIVRNCGRTTGSDWIPPPLRARMAADYAPTQRNRRQLVEKAGRVAVPYLLDPNTGVELFESAAITAYLERTYG